MATNVISGIVEVTVDGEAIPVHDTAKFNSFGEEFESGNGLDGHNWARRNPKPVELEVNLSDLPGFDLMKLKSWDGVTVVVKCDNGKMHTLSNATVGRPGSLDLAKGVADAIKITCGVKNHTISTW